jgi:hypothetical protein
MLLTDIQLDDFPVLSLASREDEKWKMELLRNMNGS